MHGAEIIEFFDRYSGTVRQEKVYGDARLTWAYGKPLGRVALHAIAKRALFSRWYGWRMDRPVSRLKVRSFIEDFGVDVSEFADPPETYRTFNEFFYRKLKPGARPLDAAADSAHLIHTARLMGPSWLHRPPPGTSAVASGGLTRRRGWSGRSSIAQTSTLALNGRLVRFASQAEAGPDLANGIRAVRCLAAVCYEPSQSMRSRPIVRDSHSLAVARPITTVA